VTGLTLPVMRDTDVVPQPTARHRQSAILGTYARVPLTIVSGEGAELIADDGRRYLDFTSGIAVNALGYGDPGLQAVLRDAAAGLIHVSNLFRTEPAEDLAEWIVAHSFASQVFFCNSGAEANEGAFKFARRWARAHGGPAKHEIVALRGSFHGRLFASLAATDRPRYRAPFRPLAGGITIVERDVDRLAAIMTAETTAALIVEPVQGEGGVRVLDIGFLRELRSLTRERRIALILDEVQCGLGRTGSLFAYERAGIEPDLLTLAKPLAGGLPMGAVLLTADIAAAIEPGDHGTTFGGGPLVSTVARYVVERLADPALLDSVREHGAWLSAELSRLAAESSHVRGVRGIGLIWGIDTAMRAAPIVDAVRELGLLILTAGDHTLRLLPPLTITRAELARGMATLQTVLT
jgi:predicted acetylornithine/succinylornithine family transaminase